jgi:hypothetical protein
MERVPRSLLVFCTPLYALKSTSRINITGDTRRLVTLLARWYRAALVVLSGGMVIGAAGGFGLLFVPPEKQQAMKAD